MTAFHLQLAFLLILLFTGLHFQKREWLPMAVFTSAVVAAIAMTILQTLLTGSTLIPFTGFGLI
jgi:hypothetical protein